MYEPTSQEYSQCVNIIKEFLADVDNVSNDEIDKMAQDVLETSYSIGGSYEKDTIIKIVKAMIDKKIII